MAETSVKECVCEHEYQDKKYGKKRRVHNGFLGKDGKTMIWRCTVCTKERS